MTVTSSTPGIDIPGRRTERSDSERTHDADMSYINSPPSSFQNLNNSYVEVSPVSPPNVEVRVFQTLNGGFSFRMDPVAEEAAVPPPAPETEVPLLPGEELILINNTKYLHPVVDGGNVMLTNYRIVVLFDARATEPQRVLVFPLQELDTVDLCQNENGIVLWMKGGRKHRILFTVPDDGNHFHRKCFAVYRILNQYNSVIHKEPLAPSVAGDVTEAFAWKFSAAIDRLPELPKWLKRADSIANEITHIDFNRLGMSEHFKITSVNEEFEICPTYPEKVIVPKGISDEDLRLGAPYRSICRFPAVVWRCPKTRAVLLRSSQPQVGILSWRNPMDEKIIEEAVNAGRVDGEERKQFVILDARGYTSAFANRARSGGFENTDCYQNAKLEFLGLPNIHTVRASFIGIREMLHHPGPNDHLLQNLQSTGWLNNISDLLIHAANCADYLSKGHAVLVHCSDGWDRTTQLTTLAKIMLDEYYRTIEGFEQLVRRDWIAFGHKLYDRQLVTTGKWTDERAPIFLQFLEAVRHMQREQPTAFQFTHAYLIKLAKHAYSGLFGSFLFNSHKEKKEAMEKRKGTLVEIWRFIGAHNEEYVNQTYDDTYVGPLKPIDFTVIRLRVWHEVFADEGEQYTSDRRSRAKFMTSLTPFMFPNSYFSSIFGGMQFIYNAAAAQQQERPSSGCATPMTTSTTSKNLVKSKSSESINSLNTQEHQCGGSHCSSAVCNAPTTTTAAAPDAAAATTTSTTTTTTAAAAMTMSSSFHQPVVFSARSYGVSSLDFDGLLKFQDDEQAMLRKKNKDRDEELRRRDKEISELRKQRELSEKNLSSASTGNLPSTTTTRKGRMNSLCELDSDTEHSSTLERALSDMSMVDPETELPHFKPPTTWETQAKQCCLCEKAFNQISLYTEERPHHCRNCGKVVCDGCSKKRYAVVEEGASVQKRVCDACYESMQATRIIASRARARTVRRHSESSLLGTIQEQTHEGTTRRQRRLRVKKVKALSESFPFDYGFGVDKESAAAFFTYM